MNKTATSSHLAAGALLAWMSLFAPALSAAAGDVVVHLKNGQRVAYPAEQVEKITFETRSPPSVGRTFTDDFSRGLGNWEAKDGRWTVRDGALEGFYTHDRGDPLPDLRRRDKPFL